MSEMNQASSSSPAEARQKAKQRKGGFLWFGKGNDNADLGPEGGVKYDDYDREMVDYVRAATAKNVWYYRDRMSVARGPCTLPTLREAWVGGIIDEGTLIWGTGLVDWIPVGNVRTLVAQIRTVEVQVATWVKKNLVLKPAIERARKQRIEQRATHRTKQIDNMF